jgi:hypothetical protein
MMRITSDIRLNLGLRLFCFGSEAALRASTKLRTSSARIAELDYGWNQATRSSLTGQEEKSLMHGNRFGTVDVAGKPIKSSLKWTIAVTSSTL